MGHIRLKARDQTLEGLILVTEENKAGAVAMGVDIGLVKAGVFKARIVKDEQAVVLRKGWKSGEGSDGGAKSQMFLHDVPLGDMEGGKLAMSLGEASLSRKGSHVLGAASRALSRAAMTERAKSLV